MKKYLLVFSLCVLCLAAYTQPSLTSSEMLSFGATTLQKLAADPTVIDTTIQGANATWDFSALQPRTNAPDLNITVMDPAQTPNGSSFPSANYAYKNQQGTTTSYYYYNLSSTKLENLGTYTTAAAHYDDPLVENVFPLSVGVSNNDTWSANSGANTGTNDITCIGSGTLIIPLGSYDALMTRTIYDNGSLTLTSYTWYNADNGAVLAQYIAPFSIVAASALYLVDITTGIQENTWVDNMVYNNPVLNNLELNFTCKKPSLLNYTVFNSLGETILNGKYAAGTAMQQLNIDFSSFSQGIYFLSLRSDASGEKAKTIRLAKMN